MNKKAQSIFLGLVVVTAFALMGYLSILSEGYTRIGDVYVVNTVVPTWTPIPTDFEVLVNVIAEPKLDGDRGWGFWTDLYVEIAEDAPYYESGSLWQLRFPESMMPAIMKDWVDSAGELKLSLICSESQFSNFRMNCRDEYKKIIE